MLAVGVLTQHLKAPTYASCKAACRVLNYLSHHPVIALCYSGRVYRLLLCFAGGGVDPVAAEGFAAGACL